MSFSGTTRDNIKRIFHGSNTRACSINTDADGGMHQLTCMPSGKTDADGGMHQLTCMPSGRLFATRHLGTISPAQTRRLGIEAQCQTQIHVVKATGGVSHTRTLEASTLQTQSGCEETQAMGGQRALPRPEKDCGPGTGKGNVDDDDDNYDYNYNNYNYTNDYNYNHYGGDGAGRSCLSLQMGIFKS